MVSNFKILALAGAVLALCSCAQKKDVTLTVIDPGHFHASLLQKHDLQGVSRTVSVYAPEGEELDQYLETIESYNSRQDEPTSWMESVHAGSDYLKALPCAGKLDAVMLSGNNRKKSDYILAAVQKGYNVLSDKPLAINESGWETLKASYDLAEEKGLVIYDLMTERYDTLNILVRKLINDRELFGVFDLSDGPAVKMTSVHHFYKEVSGTALHRPQWYYDVTQQGEGIADVTTHLIDLVFWQCFPNEAIGLEDVCVSGASHYPTRISADQFRQSTGAAQLPVYLDSARDGDCIEVMANGSMDFAVKGVPVQMNVKWNWEPQKGSSDTFEAVYKGTRATITVRQDASTGYVKQVFVKPAEKPEQMIEVPAGQRISHEEHFNLVAAQFLKYVRGDEEMPSWEKENTLTKYHITTTAVKLATESAGR